MGEHDLGGYVEVSDRIEAFYEKYPDGSLRGDFDIREVSGETFIVYRAEGYRTADDQLPGIGHAWEPFPGKTPFTKDSELMNAETSAWGRALAALGFKVKEGIASANEVRSRSGGGGNGKVKPSEGQLKFLKDLAIAAGFTDSTLPVLMDWAKATLSGGKTGSMSEAIDGLKDTAKRSETADRLQKAAGAWADKNAAEVPA